ncbi:shieldin complex subunit 3-like [Vombatus ursinus]|uniref:shieldin complex subunit 3-like n=1 Tax=Vombatus ursinus TaxID=29139 RepID=UPI000FFD0327|nr:shieldin complex subunit 3-like [Vombatus ursinus]
MSTEVVLYYRPCESDPTRLYKVAEEAINEFPSRPLLRFIPWFPNDVIKLPLKPKRLPPIISGEAAKEADQHFTISEHHRKAQNYDCTVGLPEFQPNLEKRKCLIRAQTLDEQISCGNPNEQTKKAKRHLKRSWSVSVSRNFTEKVLPLSKELQQSLEKLKLHSLYRARWTIEHSVFNNQTLEDIWIKLNRLIRHNELPFCNATIQRHVSQIWVFCDILHCEYVCSLLKGRLSLKGKMNLFVHKYGVIFSM